MAEELFKNVSATKQEPVKTGEQTKVAKEPEKAEDKQEAPSGVPSLGSNSSASEPAPVAPVPAIAHNEAKQPTVDTNLATTTVIADDDSDNQDGEDEDDTAPLQRPDELTVLKERAKLMGIKHSNNIGVDTLRTMVMEAMTAKAQENSETKDGNVFGEDPEKAAVVPHKGKKNLNLRQKLHQEKMKLVRLRITNLDPKKKDLHGEILTVANRYLGTVRKFIPYGETTDNGYHVPYCLYEMLRDRRFVSIKVRKNDKGQPIVETQWVKEFALEVLPPLTDAERAAIAANQHANGIE